MSRPLKKARVSRCSHRRALEARCIRTACWHQGGERRHPAQVKSGSGRAPRLGLCALEKSGIAGWERSLVLLDRGVGSLSLCAYTRSRSGRVGPLTFKASQICRSTEDRSAQCRCPRRSFTYNSPLTILHRKLPVESNIDAFAAHHSASSTEAGAMPRANGDRYVSIVALHRPDTGMRR